MRTKILGVSFDNITLHQAVEKAMSFLQNETTGIIFTPNPEMVMLAQRDAEFAEVLAAADLVIPDGIGIVWASRFTDAKISQRVPGIELTLALLEKISHTGHSVYFLGGAPGVASAAAAKMQEKFPNIKVCGDHHGYFDNADDAEIVAEINAAKADIVLVGLGFPRQEKWIFRHKEHTCAKIMVGVGGSLDVFSGRVRRAPGLFQKLGLEWFYRLARQPSRLLRQFALVKFVMLVVSKKGRNLE
ncbi:MAG: WecB/TagA/CpsF family glycosyltransferase [Clostridiales bacterium]|jgi:N-acetylglucosaminyldiphosphoundecaprenol N-acetyl-beta-D-mannosaminyltransferase|nr:WecB/TagA/CpsF family glycosyltransferase [Clostridiales bacterium]